MKGPTKCRKLIKKKRNAGLLYEFLVRTVSQSVVEGDTEKSARALKLLRKHFKPGSELYREFRLINALVRTTVSSESIAARILAEAREACRDYDVSALDNQKQALIRDVVGTLRDKDFFDQQVDEYRAYATAQVLLNEWRKIGPKQQTPDTVIQFEDALIRWLTCSRPEPTVNLMNNESSGTNRLLMKVMMNRLNEKYGSTLIGEQKALIKAYAFSSVKDHPDTLKSKLNEIKKDVLEAIDQYVASHGDQKVILDRLTEARDRILKETVDKVDDDTVSRFMLYVKLGAELKSEDD